MPSNVVPLQFKQTFQSIFSTYFEFSLKMQVMLLNAGYLLDLFYFKVQCLICILNISPQQCCYPYLCLWEGGGAKLPPILPVPTALECSAAAVGSKITQNRSLMIMADRRQTKNEDAGEKTRQKMFWIKKKYPNVSNSY